MLLLSSQLIDWLSSLGVDKNIMFDSNGRLSKFATLVIIFSSCSIAIKLFSDKEILDGFKRIISNH